MLAEFLGTALIAAAVVGSGIMATRLSPNDVGLQLFENVIAIIFAIGAIAVVLTPVSGAHFNPLITIADWFLGRRHGTGLTGGDVVGYVIVQTAGAIAGTVSATLMYQLPAVEWSHHDRLGWNLFVSEIIATAGLILVIFALGRAGRAAITPLVVAAYIGSAAWFTSSTAFVNPALTIARAFSDTFTGISPRSVPGFVLAQLIGLVVGLGLVLAFFPDQPDPRSQS